MFLISSQTKGGNQLNKKQEFKKNVNNFIWQILKIYEMLKISFWKSFLLLSLHFRYQRTIGLLHVGLLNPPPIRPHSHASAYFCLHLMAISSPLLLTETTKFVVLNCSLVPLSCRLKPQSLWFSISPLFPFPLD